MGGDEGDDPLLPPSQDGNEIDDFGTELNEGVDCW